MTEEFKNHREEFCQWLEDKDGIIENVDTEVDFLKVKLDQVG